MEEQPRPQKIKACAVAVLVLIGAAVITGIALLIHFLDRKYPSRDPVYSVAITGVTGLDPAAARDAAVDDPPPPAPSTTLLSPVFNLTFHIDNTHNSYGDACVPGLSRADVSYGDAILAGVSVPPFCAGKMRTGSVAARAWGDGVAVPKFLRDQLADVLYECIPPVRCRALL